MPGMIICEHAGGKAVKVVGSFYWTPTQQAADASGIALSLEVLKSFSVSVIILYSPAH